MQRDQKEIMKGILSVLKVVGVISVAVLAPNALQAFTKTHKAIKDFNGYRLKRAIKNMQKNKLVDLFERNGQTLVQTTIKGQKVAETFNIMGLRIKAPKKWDGKWRVVIFDVPETLKRNRRLFRRRLIDLGFVMLQKSTWVYPYPCLKEVSLLKEFYKVSSFVNFITAEDIDLKPDLVQKFDLK